MNGIGKPLHENMELQWLGINLREYRECAVRDNRKS